MTKVLDFSLFVLLTVTSGHLFHVNFVCLFVLGIFTPKTMIKKFVLIGPFLTFMLREASGHVTTQINQYQNVEAPECHI